MDYRTKFMVKPGKKVRLSDFDPSETAGYEKKRDVIEKIEKNTRKLAELQYRLYAENRQSLLIVLQAMDAGGKDGVINHVLAPMNPQGCRVHSFKKPSDEELSHDFLWRIHKAVPKRGEVVIFNRSHYEDVLVVRVHNLAPEKIWSKRYGFINDFERMLSFHRTRIVKFYLHIGKDEQLKRFQERLDTPEKHWKISDGDYSERKHWDAYTEAFENLLEKCSTDEAPWYVIPANRKWFRNLAVSQILVETMEDMKMNLPKPNVNIDEIRKLATAEEEGKQ